MNQKLTETFHEVADHLDVPPIDEVGFRRRVRAARGRKTLRAGSVAAAAACAVAVALYAVPGLVSQERAAGGRVATPPRAEEVASALPLVLDGRLSILGSDGGVARPGERVAEAVGAWGDDGALAIGADGRFSAYRLIGGEYHQVEAPTDVEVRQARTSNDGNTVAWLDNDGQLGLASAGKTQWTFPVTPQATLFDAQAGQALYWDEGGLHLRTGDLDIPLPTDGRPDWAMIARDVVQVAYEHKSVFFRVRGSRDPVQRSGGELISPDARLTFGVDGVVRTLAGQEHGPVTGLPGPIAKALWFDHDTFVVATGPQGGATKASVCEAATLTCEPLGLGYRSVELPTSP